MEIERKYVVKVDAGRLHDGQQICNHYIHVDEEKEVRLRKKKGEWILTTKTGHGLVRGENEVVIDEETAHVLIDIAKKAGTLHSILKTRYKLGRWEIDEFPDGLITAEIELESATERPPDFPPEITSAYEVTGVPFFSNAVMAFHGVPIKYFEFTYASDGGASLYKDLIELKVDGEIVKFANIEFDEVADIASYVEYKRRIAFTSKLAILSDHYDELWPDEIDAIKTYFGETSLTSPTIIFDDPRGTKFSGPETITFPMNKLVDAVEKSKKLKP